MKLVDLTLPTPAGNLACDEALLDRCERSGEEILRFWESPEYFVVVGYGNSVATEVNLDVCRSRNIPILRRCTGGGTVVQGPGCLNYSLILQIANTEPLHSITSTNRFVMEANRKAIESALLSAENSPIANRQSPIQVCGHTDLTLGEFKFSGNAQRRKRRALLFHGSFLLNFNLPVISELLPQPSRQPEYRRHRSHEKFLANLNLPADSTKSALGEIWSANEFLEQIPAEAIARLVHDKYATSDWNWKF